MTDIKQWYTDMPPCTKFLFTATVVISALVNFRLLPLSYLMLSWDAFSRLQVWRLVSSFFWMKFGMPFLYHLYFLYNFSRGLEDGHFAGKTADYAWFLIVVMGLMNVLGLALGVPVLGSLLAPALVYFWAQVNREQVVNFMFGLQFQAMYLPLVMILLDLAMGQFDPLTLFGMAIAHVFYFLDVVYPQQPHTQGKRPLGTPEFMRQLLPQQPGMGGFAADGTTRTEPRASSSGGGSGFGGTSWGKGRKLGSN